MPSEKAKLVAAWLDRAAKDLRGGSLDIHAQPPLIEDALFHAQQAAEKSLKAYLTYHDKPFKRTHDLDELGRPCCELDSSLTAMVDKAKDLTVFAWAFRYPGESEVPEPNVAIEALETASLLFAEIQKRLPLETHPVALF
jgi:HEPN domain-containing protein